MFYNAYNRGGYCHHHKEKIHTMPEVGTCGMMDSPTKTCENLEMPMANQCCQCQATYQEQKPICTSSKQIINQYHIIKQPYVHNYHTEVVHHHVLQNEFIPTYTCSEVHVNECGYQMPRSCC